MKRPVRVLHVLGRMLLGGAELRLIELIERLPRGEFRIDVCALSGLPGALDDRVAACWGRVIPVRLGIGFPARFLSLLRSERYDVVHSHVLHASGPILALAALSGVPVRVAHFHAMRDGKRSSIPRRVQRVVTKQLLDRCATDIIACGEGSMDAVWHPQWRQDPRCRVIYDAVDPDRFYTPSDPRVVRARVGIPPTAPLFIHVGYDTPEKNYPRLLQIFAAIHREDPSAWLLLVGEGTDRPDGHIARGVAALGLDHRVVALGARSDVPALMKAADALLLPSLREGLPGVVLEACVVGLPVLATDLPGVLEVATRLPGVRALPASARYEDWAAVALHLPAKARQQRLREGAAEAFAPSVFHVERAAEAHQALWLGTLHRRQ
jgi:glycosyltransferase involved in cell wall biosynthesis